MDSPRSCRPVRMGMDPKLFTTIKHSDSIKRAENPACFRYGNRQQESEFFVPKVPEQPQDVWFQLQNKSGLRSFALCSDDFRCKVICLPSLCAATSLDRCREMSSRNSLILEDPKNNRMEEISETNAWFLDCWEGKARKLQSVLRL